MRRPENRVLAVLRHGLLVLLIAFGGAAASERSESTESTASIEAGGDLHVASPDWRDQIIYFLMIDRFDDGDPTNSDQGRGEFDPTDHRRFSGGDLAGVTRRLDYIRGLGATAVWITPPVANQWWDGEVGYGGYHGYWAEDFSRVDAHFGDLDAYRALSRGLHQRGMYLIQDIVLNHTGNFFSYDEHRDPRHPARGYRRNAASVPVDAPSQWPFSLNDPRREADREAAIYHWTPNIVDFSRLEEERDYQLANLDDLNSDSPLVRTALRQSYAHWIREVGVDAFRIDTVFYVPPDSLLDFMHADDTDAPGVLQVARATGREDFHLFGEGFGIDRAFDDTQMRKIERYATDQQGRPVLPGMINFTLYGSLKDVFSAGRPTTELADRIEKMMTLHRDPHRMPTFVDNHDVDRFLASGDAAGLRQALLAIMTLPGIPTLYYGTEQGFRSPRRSMFAAGHGSEGRDHFDASAPLYRYLAEVSALRRGDRVFSRGRPTVLRATSAGPGALAYRMSDAGQHRLVVFNTADHPVLLDRLEAGLDTGYGWRLLFASDAGVDGSGTCVGSTGSMAAVGTAASARPTANSAAACDRAGSLSLDAEGQLTLTLPPRSAAVFAAQAGGGLAPVAESVVTLELGAPKAGRLPVSGLAPPQSRVQLVLDGRLDPSIETIADNDGHWSALLPIASLIDARVKHRLVAWLPDHRSSSAGRAFRVQPRWQLSAEVSDPEGDDHGPQRRYGYPSDPSWGEHRQMDLRAARAYLAGGSLRLELDMRSITTSWNPANGFDHVAFSIFLSLPQRSDGARALPRQNAQMPDGLRWHYRLRAHGWSNALFSADGADADTDGTPRLPGATIEVDREHQRVRFLLPATALGEPATLDGARIYVTTWDYDGGYRGLSPGGDGHWFSGGDGARDPLIMDDLLLQLGQTAASPVPPAPDR